MDVTQIMGSVTIVIEALKRARDVAKRTNDAAIQAVLLDAQEAALVLKEELINLRSENIVLRERLALQDSLSFDGGAYWRAGETRDGPFCPRCYDVERKAVRLTPTYGYKHRCPECEKLFEVLSAPRGKDYPTIRRTRG